MSQHRIYIDQPPPTPGGRLTVTGPEAEHAVRVKRLREGEAVELLDGRGTVARALVERVTAGKGSSLGLLIESVRVEPALAPRVEVWSATPKGGRVDELVDSLSQVGAAAWSPMKTARSVVSPREGKLDRLRRIAVEAAKQAGRAWIMETGEEREFAEALAGPANGPRQHNLAIVLADASGEPYAPTGAATIRILIGPEGGWTEGELAAARAAGGCAQTARFGPHTMRIETAAPIAAAIVLHAEKARSRT